MSINGSGKRLGLAIKSNDTTRKMVFEIAKHFHSVCILTIHYYTTRDDYYYYFFYLLLIFFNDMCSYGTHVPY
jgi:hypothetical protein